MQNILLTGCSGYIGRILAAHLKRVFPCRLVGIDRVATPPEALDHFILGNLLDKPSLAQALEGIDCVLHLAAARTDWGLSDDAYYRDNYDATKNLIEAGAGIKNWVFYSTVGVLGSSHEPLDEQAPYAPSIAYGASKAEAEKLFHQFAKEDPKARILIIRPSAVYGPGNPPNTNIYRLIDAIYKNRFVMIGKGQALKTTSAQDNLIQATFFLMKRLQAGVQTFIYVDEPVLSTSELVDQIHGFLGKKSPTWHLPLWLAKPVAYISDVAAALLKVDFPITAARIDKFCTSTNFDSSATRRLGFEQPVSNEEMLRKTVRWYLEQQQTLDKKLPEAV